MSLSNLAEVTRDMLAFIQKTNIKDLRRHNLYHNVSRDVTFKVCTDANVLFPFSWNWPTENRKELQKVDVSGASPSSEHDTI